MRSARTQYLLYHPLTVQISVSIRDLVKVSLHYVIWYIRASETNPSILKTKDQARSRRPTSIASPYLKYGQDAISSNKGRDTVVYWTKLLDTSRICIRFKLGIRFQSCSDWKKKTGDRWRGCVNCEKLPPCQRTCELLDMHFSIEVVCVSIYAYCLLFEVMKAERLL